MKVVLAHTDFRIYWPPRLKALRSFCAAHDTELKVVEIAGKGSPYRFAGGSLAGDGWWTCLFPDSEIERVRPRSAAKALWSALEAIRPDVVVAGAIAYTSGTTAVAWARARRRAVVIGDDARLADVPRNRLVNWVKRRICRNVDAMLLPAPSHVPDYGWFGVPRAKMFFGLDVVDNRFFREKADEARRARAEMGRKRGLPERFLLGVGRQTRRKNWGGLLRAWASFRGLRPQSDLGLVLVGNGPERAGLEEAARQSQDGRILFRDFMDHNELAVYYGLATAFVLPSHIGETWGLVVNEAMAAGLPVLVSRECGCAQTLVKTGRNGWTFAAGDGPALSQVLVDLDRKDQGELQEMGRHSREVIADWGLDRFCEGVWDAANYARQGPKLRTKGIDRLILSAWKGRYRPAP